MCASVIGKPDPQTERLLEVIFGSGRNGGAVVEKQTGEQEAKENGEEPDSSL